MKASLRSVRISPKKAALVAKMVRGLPVPEAVESLRKTNKKGARILEKLLRSAMANASNNEKQDPQMMVVKSLVVNKAQAYHRGVPMARGRIRRMRKFLSHIDLTLGLDDEVRGASSEVRESSTSSSTPPRVRKDEKKPATTRKAESGQPTEAKAKVGKQTASKATSTKKTATSTSQKAKSPAKSAGAKKPSSAKSSSASAKKSDA